MRADILKSIRVTAICILLISEQPGEPAHRQSERENGAGKTLTKDKRKTGGGEGESRGLMSASTARRRARHILPAPSGNAYKAGLRPSSASPNGLEEGGRDYCETGPRVSALLDSS